MPIEELNSEQNARVAALKTTREILAERTTGPFTNNSKTVDTFDLYNIASWIIDGQDPWESKRLMPDIEDIILKPGDTNDVSDDS